VPQNLLGEWTLVRVRGGRQREPVQHTQVVESWEAGDHLVTELVKLRLRHGYVMLNSIQEQHKPEVTNS
jgi:hypothetical protein